MIRLGFFNKSLEQIILKTRLYRDGILVATF